MPDMIRAFAAVHPSESAAGEMERLLSQLVPMARLRWVNRAQLHMTLKFLGEQSPEVIAKAKKALMNIEFPEFEIELNRAGAFPNMNGPRVLWLGGTKGAAELTALAKRVEDEFASVGIPRSDKSFKPHLTLARCGGRGAATLPEALVKALDAVPSFSWTCREISLMRSELTPGGPIYTRL